MASMSRVEIETFVQENISNTQKIVEKWISDSNETWYECEEESRERD